MNEYTGIAGEMKREELQSSLYVGARQQPDTEAKLQSLADRVGLPVDAVRLKQPEVELHDRLQAFDYEKVIKESPKLSAWLADPKNSAVAHDDWERLSNTEKLLTHGRDYLGALGQGVIGQGAGLVISGASTMLDVGARAIDRPIRQAFGDKFADLFWYQPPRIGGLAIDPLDALKQGGQSLKQIGNMMAPPQQRQSLGTDVASGIGQLGFQIAAFLTTGGAATGGMMFAQGADIMADKTAKDGAPSALRDSSIILGGTVTRLTEQYGLDKILNRVPPEVKNRTLRFIADKLVAGGIEAAQELTEGLLHDVTRRVLTNPDAPILEGIDREMTAAGLSAAIVRSALGVKGFRTAQQNQQFFEALGEDATNSKLRERLPERYQALIEQYTKDGPVQQVMVPAQQFAEYFQSAGIDPSAMAAQTGASNFAEALASGGDVVIPMAGFMAQIAPTDHLQGLMPDLRLGADEMTMREAELAEANRDENDRRLQEEIARINEAAKSEHGIDAAIQRIVTDVEGQLATRYDAQTARTMATTMRGLAVLANRANPDADPLLAAQALWAKYGLQVQANPLPEILTRAPAFDAQIDPLLDRLRKGEIPSDRDLYSGLSLIDYIRQQGGLKMRGEFTDGDKWDRDNRRPGQRSLFSDAGLDVDDARMLAEQDGYQVGDDETSFIAAIEDEMAGNPMFAMGAERDSQIKVLTDLMAMDRVLSEMGLDLQALDNAAVKAALREKVGGGGAAYNHGAPYEGDTIEVDGTQRPATNSNGQRIAQTEEGLRNFWRWFGDSKVVDADGKPLVVYHGTTADVEAFDKKYQGAVTRATSSKSGFFFTSSPRTAQSYADHGALVTPIETLIAEADKAGDRGNWDKYDEKINEAERLEAELSDPANRGRGQNLIPVYLAASKPMIIDANGETPSGIGGIDPLLQKAKRAGNDGVVIKNFDDAAGLANDNADHYIVFDPTQIKSATGNRGTFDPNDANILKQDNRGSIQIGADRRMKISLFEKANLSTFLHESGHFYLEVMGDLADDPNASQQVKDDYASILKFLGVENRSQIETKHHEKFARANEAYLMEGKAPAAELRGVFQRFSAWLKLIYRQLTALNVELTDEVRGVMDRIYATDAEIARASQEADIPHLFLDAKSAGMTEAEFAVYQKNIADTTVEAKDELQRKLMRIEKLKREAWWKDELKKTADEVAAEYDATPEAQAFARMAATGSTERMNRAQLIERYGEDITKRLPRQKGAAVYAGDGQDIDSLAEVMGYANADDMVQALVNLPNRARYIAAESNQRMMERHGDLLNDVALADEAMQALHNEQREKVLKIELRALNKQIKGDMQQPDVLRSIARGLIGQKQVRDISPHSYLVAERKAAREAFQQMSEGGDRMEAFRAKQRELFNHYMYLEATKARAEADSIVKYLRGFEKQTTRQKLGKAGADYLDQIDALLERYELKNVSLKQIGRRESLGAWLAKHEADGNTVAVPLEIQDETRLTNWKQVPMDELRAVRDSVKNIAHLANLKNKLIRKGKLIEFDGVVSELLAALDASGLQSTGDLGRPNMKGARAADKGAKAWRRFDASLLKVEQIIEWLDGGKIDGPWARYVFDLADNAQTLEYDLHKLVTTKIEEISKAMPKAWRHGMLDRTTVRLPGFDQPLTRYDLISIAMNLGNAQNIQRLQDGYGWSDSDMQSVRDALTEQDMAFVQNTWDALEQLWPFMAELEERTSGLPPEKVEARALEVAGKTWRGGYYPLAYDPRYSNAGERQTNEAESVQNFMAQGYGRASTNRGATKQRLENFKAPVLLDFEQVVTSHLAKVIKDISHREAVIGINKILTQSEIKQGLIDRIGEDRYTEFRKWLQTLVMDRADTLHQATGPGSWVMKARTNTAIVTMGWKISTMLAQFAGFTPVLDLVKPQFLAKALIQSATAPQETWQMIAAKSGEMRNRANTIERDARDALLRMRGEGGMLADVRRTAFFLTAFADRMVTTPAWLGGYQQALAEGKSEEDAVRAGDRAVRLSQGAGGSKDLAAVQRNNELMKLLTMYYTPFSVLYARLRDIGNQTALQGIGYLPKAVARLTALVILPAVLGEALAGRGPDEDEDEVWWAIRKMLLYPLATLPVIRDFSGFLEAGIIKASGEGEMKFPPSYKLSPVMAGIEKVAKLPGKVADASTGEKEWDAVAWDVFETSGYVLGLPTAQPRITGEYLADLLSGDADPENAGELLHDALFRRQK